MVKNLKYIIKRILIGVGIVLVLSFLKGSLILNAHALTSSYSFGAKDEIFGTNYAVFTYSTTGNPWTNYSDGTFTFSFQAYKTGGDSISSNALLRHVVINSSNGATYACNVGTTTIGNSTFTNGLYSASCPVTFENNAYFKSIVFYFDSNNAVTGPNYRFLWNGLITYSSKPQSNTNVNVDTSGTTGAINNQINNDNTNTQNIINNQDSNTQDIIDNQNQNTQDTIESQKACSIIDKNNIVLTDRYLTSSGNILNQSYSLGWGITDFISVQGSDIEKLSSLGSGPSLCFYNINKELISCSQNSSIAIGKITIPNNTSFVRFSIEVSNNKPQYKICTNGNQAIVNSQQDINNTLNDDTPVNNSTIEDLFGDLESSDTPISDLLTMPITLLQAYISGMSGSCNRIELGRLYGHLLFIPCINISNYLGTDLWNLIDIVLAMYLIYEFSQLLITAFDSITSLKDNFSWLFGVEGKHVGAPSTRVERNSDLY